MPALNFDEIQVGTELPAFTTPPVSRLTLALYCGASGDHNPLHVDIDFAREAGMPDVIAHGMLSMAYLGRLVTQWVPQENLRSLAVRFAAITHVGDELTCSGRVSARDEASRSLRLSIDTRDQRGELKLSGEAVVVLAD